MVGFPGTPEWFYERKDFQCPTVAEDSPPVIEDACPTIRMRLGLFILHDLAWELPVTMRV